LKICQKIYQDIWHKIIWQRLCQDKGIYVTVFVRIYIRRFVRIYVRGFVRISDLSGYMPEALSGFMSED
jgi:hypothetical protein